MDSHRQCELKREMNCEVCVGNSRLTTKAGRIAKRHKTLEVSIRCQLSTIYCVISKIHTNISPQT